MAQECTRKIQIWDGKILIDGESGGVAVSETCCCVDQVEENRCPCASVCQWSWEFAKETDGTPLNGWFDIGENLISAAPYSMSVWTLNQKTDWPDCNLSPPTRPGSLLEIVYSQDSDTYVSMGASVGPDLAAYEVGYHDPDGTYANFIPVTIGIDDAWSSPHMLTVTAENLTNPDRFIARFYLDGVPYVFNPQERLGQLYLPQQNDVDMFVGRSSTSLVSAWPRCVDNLAIWDRRLTDAEIVALWNSGAGVIPTDAKYRWCPTANWQQDQIDAVGGKILTYHAGSAAPLPPRGEALVLSTGNERDGFLDCIQDQYAQNVIGVYQSV